MLVRPKVVVALGAISARGILQSGETPLSALRGTFHSFQHARARYLQSQLSSPHGRYFRKAKGLGGYAVCHGTGRSAHL